MQQANWEPMLLQILLTWVTDSSSLEPVLTDVGEALTCYDYGCDCDCLATKCDSEYNFAGNSNPSIDLSGGVMLGKQGVVSKMRFFRGLA